MHPFDYLMKQLIFTFKLAKMLVKISPWQETINVNNFMLLAFKIKGQVFHSNFTFYIILDFKINNVIAFHASAEDRSKI